MDSYQNCDEINFLRIKLSEMEKNNKNLLSLLFNFEKNKKKDIEEFVNKIEDLQNKTFYQEQNINELRYDNKILKAILETELQ